MGQDTLFFVYSTGSGHRKQVEVDFKSRTFWGIQCRLVLSLTHKHQRHTSHNTAGKAPQHGIERRVPESGWHTFSWPRSSCGGSAEQDKERAGNALLHLCLWEKAKLDFWQNWFARQPKTCSSKCVCVCVCTYVYVCMYLCWTHSTGVSEVLVCHIRAGGADLPGVSKQLGSGLHDALSCRKVILCVSIKVSTQPSNPTPQVGRNTYIYSHTCRHYVEWKIHYHWFVTSPQLNFWTITFKIKLE